MADNNNMNINSNSKQTEQEEPIYIIHGVEVKKSEWDAVKDHPYKLPRKVALQIFKERDERKAEERKKREHIRPDKWQGPSIIIDPIHRTAVKIDQLLPKYLNYGSFCKMASLRILECVNWMNVIKDCYERGSQARANIKPGMMTQSHLDFFTHLKKESVYAMKQYDKARFDMQVYVYIYNVINIYYRERLIRNKYLLKNDVLPDIFQDRIVEWYNDWEWKWDDEKNEHVKVKYNDLTYPTKCAEQDSWEGDFLNAIKKYNEICKNPDELHYFPEKGRNTRCEVNGNIDVPYIVEYMNWYVRIKERTDEQIVNQFHFITNRYPKALLKMKFARNENGKVRFKFYANSPYWKKYNYNNDTFDEDITFVCNKSNIKDNKDNNKVNNNALEPFDSIKLLSDIYNSAYTNTTSVSSNIYINNTSYQSYVLDSNINYNIDNNIYRDIISNNIYNNSYKNTSYNNTYNNISYFNYDYYNSYNKWNDIVFYPWICKHDSPPGDIESDKPPDGKIKRYIYDRSIII